MSDDANETNVQETINDEESESNTINEAEQQSVVNTQVDTTDENVLETHIEPHVDTENYVTPDTDLLESKEDETKQELTIENITQNTEENTNLTEEVSETQPSPVIVAATQDHTEPTHISEVVEQGESVYSSEITEQTVHVADTQEQPELLESGTEIISTWDNNQVQVDLLAKQQREENISQIEELISTPVHDTTEQVAIVTQPAEIENISLQEIPNEEPIFQEPIVEVAPAIQIPSGVIPPPAVSTQSESEPVGIEATNGEKSADESTFAEPDITQVSSPVDSLQNDVIQAPVAVDEATLTEPDITQTTSPQDISAHKQVTKQNNTFNDEASLDVVDDIDDEISLDEIDEQPRQTTPIEAEQVVSATQPQEDGFDVNFDDEPVFQQPPVIRQPAETEQVARIDTTPTIEQPVSEEVKNQTPTGELFQFDTEEPVHTPIVNDTPQRVEEDFDFGSNFTPTQPPAQSTGHEDFDFDVDFDNDGFDQQQVQKPETDETAVTTQAPLQPSTQVEPSDEFDVQFEENDFAPPVVPISPQQVSPKVVTQSTFSEEPMDEFDANFDDEPHFEQPTVEPKPVSPSEPTPVQQVTPTTQPEDEEFGFDTKPAQQASSDEDFDFEANFEEPQDPKTEVQAQPLQTELLDDGDKLKLPFSPDQPVATSPEEMSKLKVASPTEDEFGFALETPQDDEFGDFDDFAATQQTQAPQDDEFEDFGDFETTQTGAEATDEFGSFEEPEPKEQPKPLEVQPQPQGLDYQSLSMLQQAVIGSLLGDTTATVAQNVTNLLEMIVLPPHLQQKPKNQKPVNPYENIPTNALETLFKTQAPHNIDALNKMARWPESQIEKYFLRAIGVQKRANVKKKVMHVNTAPMKPTPKVNNYEDEGDTGDRKVQFQTTPSTPQKQDELNNIAELVWSREDLPTIGEPELPPLAEAEKPVPVVQPIAVPVARPTAKQDTKDTQVDAETKRQLELQKQELKRKEQEKQEKKEALRRMEQERKKQQEEEAKRRQKEEEERKKNPPPVVKQSPPVVVAPVNDGFDADFDVDFDDFPNEPVQAPTIAPVVATAQPVKLAPAVEPKQDFTNFDLDWGDMPVMAPKTTATVPATSVNGTSNSFGFDDDDGFGDDQLNQFVSDIPDLSFVVPATKSTPTTSTPKKETTFASFDDFLNM